MNDTPTEEPSTLIRFPTVSRVKNNIEKKNSGHTPFSSNYQESLDYSTIKHKIAKEEKKAEEAAEAALQQKLLMNMVIHDLRSPSSQVQFAAETAMAALIKSTSQLKQIIKIDQEDYSLLDRLASLSQIVEQIENELTSNNSRRNSKDEMASLMSEDIDENRANNDSPFSMVENFNKLYNMVQKCTPYLKSTEAKSQATRFLELISKEKEDHSQKKKRSIQQREPESIDQFLQLKDCRKGDLPIKRRANSQRLLKRDTFDEANASLSSSLSDDASSNDQNRSLSQKFEGQKSNEPKLLTAVFEKSSAHSSLLKSSHGLRFSKTAQYKENQTFCLGVRKQLSQHQAINRRADDRSCLQLSVTFNSKSVSNLSASPVPKPNTRSSISRLKVSLNNLQQKWRNNLELRSLALEQLQRETEKIDKMARSSKCSSSILLNLINDLLDMAKAENQALTLTNQEFQLHEAVTGAAETLEFMAIQKNIQLEVNMPNELSRELSRCYGDGDRIRQVLVNLISNSLKFTEPEGTVSIDVESKLDENNDAGEEVNEEAVSIYSTKICVRDTGQGISEVGLSKLFQNFSALQEHRGSNSRGTGLGLCICKMLVEQMGGSIAVTSELGVGTTFEISLPLKVLPTLDEESSVSSQSLSSDLQDENCRAEFASVGRGSANPVRRGQPRRSCSLNLEEANQIFHESSTRQIIVSSESSGEKSQESQNLGYRWKRAVAEPHYPTIQVQLSSPNLILTSSRRDQSEKGSTRGSMKGYRKPVRSNTERAIQKFCNLKVLLANDEPVALMAQEQMFKDHLGATVVDTAMNGLKAVESTEQNEYDLILLDLNMPVMGGLEAASRIRKAKPNIPMVAVTASTITLELEAECKQAGFTQWLTVPLTLNTLKRTVEELCEL